MKSLIRAERDYQEYSDNLFWKKAGKYARLAGIETIEIVLKLYYVLQDKDTPKWAKTIIYSALIYFISPVDALPDLLPGGYIDDLSTLLSAVATVSAHIKEDHAEKAKIKVAKWFSH